MNESRPGKKTRAPSPPLPLPPPPPTGGPALSEALASRASLRRFLASPCPGGPRQILWATDGVIPGTAGGPLPRPGDLSAEVRAVLGDVPGLPRGSIATHPGEHSIEQESEGDRRTELMAATVGQADLAVARGHCGDLGGARSDHRPVRTRGIPYVLLEAGNAAQTCASR
jgi:hypothetical protein